MKSQEIKDRAEYDKVMEQIEKLLQKATKNGGFEKLDTSEKDELNKLSLLAEQFEDEKLINRITD